MTIIWRLCITLILLGLSFFLFPHKVMEIITLLAVIVALFRDDLYSIYVPPNLIITCSTSPSHFHEIPATTHTGQFVENQAWLGVIVENRGIGPAKKVELLFNGIKSNRVRDFATYRSLPMVRSWIQSAIVTAIHKNIPIRFDICFIRHSHPNAINFHFLSTPNGISSIPCVLNEESFFDFEVVAVSDNARSAKKKIRISYNGDYVRGFNVTYL